MSLVLNVVIDGVEHRCQVVITRRFVPEHITASCSGGDWSGGLFDCVLNAELAWREHVTDLSTPGKTQQEAP